MIRKWEEFDIKVVVALTSDKVFGRKDEYIVGLDVLTTTMEGEFIYKGHQLGRHRAFLGTAREGSKSICIEIPRKYDLALPEIYKFRKENCRTINLYKSVSDKILHFAPYEREALKELEDAIIARVAPHFASLFKNDNYRCAKRVMKDIYDFCTVSSVMRA